MGVIVTAPFFLCFFFAGEGMIRLFLNEGSAQAFSTGEQFLRVVAPFYFVIGAKLMIDGVLRGAGAMLQFCLLYTSRCV